MSALDPIIGMLIAYTRIHLLCLFYIAGRKRDLNRCVFELPFSTITDLQIGKMFQWTGRLSCPSV